MNKSMVTAGVVIAAIVAVGVGVLAFSGTRDDAAETNQQSTPQSRSQSPASSTPMPSAQSSQNIVELAAETDNLSTLVAAVKAGGLVETLSGAGPFTVFAPTNAAFSALPAGTLDNLLKPENKATLSSILTYHVVPAKVMSGELSDGQTITTVNGGTLTVKKSGDTVTLTDATGATATVTAADIQASNGVVHLIDAVVLPQ